MIVRCNLWINEDGGVRVTKRQPQPGSLGEREIVVPLTVSVPDEWFRHRTPPVELDLPELNRGDVMIDAEDVQP